jgi:hypothetical protein
VDRGVPVGGAAALPAPGECAPALISRRRLLQSGAVAVAAGSVGLGAKALTDSAPGLVIPVSRLRRSAYAPYVGSRFGLSVAGGASAPVVLSAAEGFGRSGHRRMAEAEDVFALIFHAGRATPRLDQAVMHVRHPAGWSIPLLVSPAGTGRDGMDYAAVINRTTPNHRSRS